jgi:Uncharacterized conserved protein
MHFHTVGKENSKDTVALALKTAVERNIKHIVVASSRGNTAKLLKNTNDIKIICVTHANGYPETGKAEMSQEIRKELADIGITVLTTTHVLSGAERGISRAFGGAYPVEIIAHSLRMLGQGTKVCVEVAIMALDAGLIPYGEPIIAIGGTGQGADTAVIITPSHASSIFETKIHEIICKPSLN